MATNGTFANQDQLKGNGEPAPAPTTAEPTSSSTSSNLSKDEVGWYFVEQYYTTLSKTPEKLHVSSCTSIVLFFEYGADY